VDVAKGISILLVAFYHSTLMFNRVGFDVSFLSSLNEHLAPIRMPMFFTAAGFFAASSVAQPWAALFRRRIGYFIYLFLLWTLIRYVFFAVVPNPQTPSEGHSLKALAVTIMRPETGLWFLWALAIYYLGAKLTARILPVLVLPAAILISIAGFSGALPLSWVHANILKYFVFFYAACNFRQLIATWVSARFKLLLSLAPAYLVLVLAVDVSPWRALDGALLFLSAVVGVLCISTFADIIAPPRAGRGLAHIGQNTLGIYLVHVMCLAALAQIAKALLGGGGGAGAGALVLAATAIAVWACRQLERAVERTGVYGWLYAVPWGASRRVSAAA
jgi:uncharacterized membrane protein YcfT